MKLFLFLLCALFIGCNISEKDSVNVFPEGGYEFPKKIEHTDSNFFYYPIKDIESTSDSLDDAYYDRMYLKAFNEPNLSLRSFEKPIFRLSFKPYFELAYIITLTQEGIIIKRGNRVNLVCEDEARLTELENTHLSILKRNYPIIKNNKQINQKRQSTLDSLVIVYPKLLDPNYYEFLLDKLYLPCASPYTFNTSKISLSKHEYNKVVNSINASGYWKMTLNRKCQNISDYNVEFILEANTSSKYNIVKSYVCDGDSSAYITACKELVKIAGLDKEINLGWTQNK